MLTILLMVQRNHQIKNVKFRNTVVHDLNNILNNAVLVETTSNTKKDAKIQLQKVKSIKII